MFYKYGISLGLLLAVLSLSGFASPAALAAEEGNPWYIWLIVLAALVVFVSFVIWWWIYADKEEEEAARPSPVAEHRVAEVAEPEAPARPDTPDDLKRIEGIGPKISGVFQAAGISTFAQLASTDVEQLRRILGEADPNLLRLADPTSWPEQAGFAAAGDWEALAALQDRLKGGRWA